MCFQGDYAALLSAFTEIGLKLRMDMPEDAMQVTNFFFRRSIPGKESPVSWIILSDVIPVAKKFQKLCAFYFTCSLVSYDVHLVFVVHPLTADSESCMLLVIVTNVLNRIF